MNKKEDPTRWQSSTGKVTKVLKQSDRRRLEERQYVSVFNDSRSSSEAERCKPLPIGMARPGTGVRTSLRHGMPVSTERQQAAKEKVTSTLREIHRRRQELYERWIELGGSGHPECTSTEEDCVGSIDSALVQHMEGEARQDIYCELCFASFLARNPHIEWQYVIR